VAPDPSARLPRTATVLIATTPLFAPLYAAASFAVAYQSAQGLDAATIALLSSAVALLSLPFFFAGALAAERWGRLASLSLFDVVGFLLPALLLATATSPWQVAAAVLLVAVSQGAQAPGQSLLLEGAGPDTRPRVLGRQRLALLLATAPLPLAAAYAVRRTGLVPAVRALYAAGALGVALMVALRWMLLRRRARADAPAVRVVRPASWSLRGLEAPGIRPVLLATTLVAFGGGLGVLAQLRILDRLHVDPFWLGPLAAAWTLADVAASLVAARARSAGGRWALAGLGLLVAGTLAFLVSREPVGLLGSYLLLAAGGAWTGLGTTAWLHDAAPESMRERAVALQLALRTAGATLGPALGGWLYLRHGDAPWVAATGVFLVAALVLAVRIGRRSGAGVVPTA
jgi:MFS family permease